VSEEDNLSEVIEIGDYEDYLTLLEKVAYDKPEGAIKVFVREKNKYKKYYVINGELDVDDVPLEDEIYYTAYFEISLNLLDKQEAVTISATIHNSLDEFYSKSS